MAEPSTLEQIRGFLRLTTHHRGEPAGAYDDAADGYDAFADVFDATVGAPALRKFDELVQQAVPVGGAVLDIGAGTGRRTERILGLSQPARVVAFDASARMLDRARDRLDDPRIEFVQGDARSLPFDDETFDVVCSTWLLSILDDPIAVVTEFLRVLKPGGRAIYAFLSRPDTTLGDAVAWVGDNILTKHNPLTHTLSAEESPYHDCGRSSLHRFAGGFTTVVSLGTCCTVTPAAVPASLDA